MEEGGLNPPTHVFNAEWEAVQEELKKEQDKQEALAKPRIILFDKAVIFTDILPA